MNQKEQTETLLKKFDGYLAQDPGNLALLADAFDIALAAGAFERAQSYLASALALAPDDVHFIHREANWLAAVGRWDEAVARQRTLCARFPDNAELKLSLASLYYHQHDFATVAVLLQDLQSIGGLPPEGHGLLLRTWHQLSRLDEAVAYGKVHTTALQADPTAAAAYSLILVDAEQFAGAKTWAEHALQLHADNAEALTALGSVALAERDPAKAQACLQRAIELRPQDGRVWSALGLTALLSGRIQDSLSAFDNAISFMPSHIGTWHGFGWTAIAAKDLPRAERAFEQALRLDRNFAESHGGLAVVHAQQGRADEARAEIQLALRLDRRSLSAKYAEAILSGVASDPAAFTALAERVLAAVPGPGGASMASWVIRDK